MGKVLMLACLVLSLGLVAPATAQTKMSFGACKTKVMQDPRNLDGKSRNYCGRSCMVKVRACMRGVG
jgi:hypothetical protein